MGRNLQFTLSGIHSRAGSGLHGVDHTGASCLNACPQSGHRIDAYGLQ